MLRRELDVSLSPGDDDDDLGASASARREITLISSPNWTAIVFLAALAFLHFCIATSAFLNGRWEGYLSAALSCVFTTASVLSFHVRSRVRFEPARRRIQIHSGIGRLSYRRSIPFGDVHAVRLTLSSTGDARDASIEVLCDNEDFDCPPTSIPRQEALYLAMMLNVQLIKVEACSHDEAPSRLEEPDDDDDTIEPELNSRGL